MSIKCPNCKREYDVTLFEFGRRIVCECGRRIGLEHEEVLTQLEWLCRQYDIKLENEKLSELRRAADKIAVLIMNTDYPYVDIEIEMSRFKDLIKGLFPGKVHLYELIYEPRFKRLWNQFREMA